MIILFSLLLVVIVAVCAICWWLSKMQWQDAVIDLYIKIYCDK